MDVDDESTRADVLVNLDFDFTQRYVEIRHYTFKDVLIQIGGLKAIVEPALAAILPIFAVTFFFRLANIIKRKYENRMRMEIRNFFKKTKEALNRALHLIHNH